MDPVVPMTAQITNAGQNVLRQSITGSRRLSNYWWAIVVTMGATGFLLAAISSYTKVSLLPFSDPTLLIFVPQGLAMGFYGLAGTLFGIYLWLTILWDVGGGYNEFNKETEQVKVFRWGFPGKNRSIEVTCKTDDVQAVRVEIRDGLNPKRALYLRVKGMRDVPLTQVGQPIALAALENQGAELARFLGVPLEGL